MAASTNVAPVYGGNLYITFDSETFPLDAELYLVFQGTRQRHVTSGRFDGENTLHSIVPAHVTSENVELTIYRIIDRTCQYITRLPFSYQYDSLYFLVHFLIDSVYSDAGLDNLDNIYSDKFDINKEDWTTLDERLVEAFRYIPLPIGWNLLGGSLGTSGVKKETLLHFCGRLGLYRLACFLLDNIDCVSSLQIENSNGETPPETAINCGFKELAELFTRFDGNGMVTGTEPQQISTENGLIQHHGNTESTVLSTYLDSPPLPVEEDIDVLQSVHKAMKRRNSQDVPKSSRHHHSHRSNRHKTWSSAIPTEPDCNSVCENDKMERAIDRLFKERQEHRKILESVCGPVLLTGLRKHSGQTNGDNSNTLLFPSAESREITSTGEQWGILEGSINSLRGISNELLKLRDVKSEDNSFGQDLRKESLARLSLSCPALDVEGRDSPQSSIDETDHHKSMLDLAEDSENHEVLDVETSEQLVDTNFVYAQSVSNDIVDPNIRICVNGVTVDSSSDYSHQIQEVQGENQDFVDQSDGIVKDEITKKPKSRRRSWCPNTNIDKTDTTTRSTRARMLALTGKSMSLTSLDDGNEASDEEDYHDAREQPTPSLSRMKLKNDVINKTIDDVNSVFYDRNISQVETTGSSPQADDMPDASTYFARLLSEGAVSGPSVTNSVPSVTDSVRYQRSNSQIEESTAKEVQFRTYSMEAAATTRSYDEEDGSNLNVPAHMTKSISTPSLPAAAVTNKSYKSPDRKRSTRRETNREGKHALFQRQQEVEEDEDGTVLVRNKKSSISLQDFLNEELKRSPSPDSDDKNKPKKEEDRKKRKTSVFSRISYRNKKKEKDSKIRATHQFVSICYSNNTACDICHKTLANKPALKCENCLLNIHENNCQDQILPCDKNMMIKVIPRNGQTSHGPALMDRQTHSVQGSGLRPSHSFKDKRSISAPNKASQHSTAPFVPHRHSLPANSTIPDQTTSGGYISPTWSNSNNFSRFLIYRPINEETEVDSMGPAQELGPSNITDTISESLESLEGVPSDEAVLDDEPDLMLNQVEPEAWSVSIDKKTVKKLGTKDIKRQDHIWELILTEKQYCRTLKIMQKVFNHGLLNELQMPQEQVERLFPKLDELIEIHTTFLRQLLQLQKKRADRFVEEVGPILLEMFHGTNAEKMKIAYGCFCSKHKESVALYKDYLKTERKFHSFFRKCSELPMVKKREFPDFILGVTLRLSKYPLLIEAIQNSTKDKKDRERTREAHECSRNVNYEVDQEVASYERLVDLQKNIDSRSTTVYKGKKFKRQDLTAGDRKLVFSGTVAWKNARGRVTDILTVVLTDLIVFLQENNQKYTFYVQDNKSCIVPLYKLLVREKNDSRDSHGIYLICQSKTQPEMYELVCKSKSSRDDWTSNLKKAIEKCPVGEEEVSVVNIQESEADRLRKAERAAKIQYIIELLHQKDRAIKQCCEEKNELMVELLEVTNTCEDSNSRPNSQDYSRGSQSLEVLQAAILEASRLTTILQGSGTHLSRSVSSVGEHVSNSYVAVPIPKRAETFAGFDSSFDASKGAIKKRFVPQIRDNDGRSPSLLSLDKPDADNSGNSIPEHTSELSNTESPNYRTQSPNHRSSSTQQAWEKEDDSLRPADRLGELGSFSEFSRSSISSLGHNQEQMSSIAQLVKYLHSLMSLTTEQGTAVEELRSQLVTANEKINKLSLDVNDKKSSYQHNQLEELRNLQENYSKERQEWEKMQSQKTYWLESETDKLEEQRRILSRREADLRRNRETLQKQIDMLKEAGLPLSSSFAGNQTVPDPTDYPDSRQNRIEIAHKRSASADFYKGSNDDLERLNQLNQKESSDNRGNGIKPRHSMGNLPSFNAGQKQNMPLHLLSTTNEKKVSGVKQQIPLKLIGTPPVPLHQQKPSLLKGTISNPAHQRSLGQGPSTHNAPSNLSLVKRLAEPQQGNKLKSSPPPPPVSTSPTTNQSAPINKKTKSDNVIYF